MDESIHEEWDVSEGQCVGCDRWARLNDLGLCADCAGKLERDLIRERDWDYSASAFLLSEEAREQLRHQVIREYGELLELIAPLNKSPHKTPLRSSNGKPAQSCKR